MRAADARTRSTSAVSVKRRSSLGFSSGPIPSVSQRNGLWPWEDIPWRGVAPWRIWSGVALPCAGAWRERLWSVWSSPAQPGSRSPSILRQPASLWQRRLWCGKATARAIPRSCPNRCMLARNSSYSKNGAPGSLSSLTMGSVAGFGVTVPHCSEALSAVSSVSRYA